MAVDGANLDNLDAWVREVSVALRGNDWRRAIRGAEHALGRGLVHPRLLQVRAIGHERNGRNREALVDLEHAHQLAPNDIGIANALGICLTRAGRPDEASRLLEKAAHAGPEITDSWFNLGNAWMAAGDIWRAREAFERAVELEPTRAETLGKLATLASHRKDSLVARAIAQRALALDPAEPASWCAIIEADLDENDYTAAEAHARLWLSLPRLGQTARHLAFGLIGDALDGQGRAAGAFAAYSQSNAIFRTIHASRFKSLDTNPLRTTFAQMETEFGTIPKEAWLPARSAGLPAEATPRGHVFLMGFMRSGTTLLEQVLNRHPDVVTLEEIEAMAKAGAALLGRPGGLRQLSTLSEDQADRYRSAYWKAVQEAGREISGKVFVDKLPFNGLKLPLIAKLFPDAKIIFALRDPRDIVLSCFQRRLQPNNFTYEMATLDGAARLYASYMSLVRQYRETLTLSIRDHRHELLIANFGDSVRQVCAHVSLDFHPAMITFQDAAREGRVYSQTSRQLGDGLSAKGVDHWRQYSGEMQPVAEILAPWVKAYGYSPD